MQDLPSSVLIGIIVISVSFMTLLIGVVVTYFWIVKKHFSDLGKMKKFDDQLAENANQILEQARSEAEQMRQNASLEAQKIIDSATDFQAKREQFITQELQALEQTYKQEFEKTIVAMQNNIQKSLTGLPEEIKASMQNEMEVYRKNFREELATALSSSKGLIKEAYSKLEEDLDEYKQQRYGQIDDKIIEIVKMTAREVLGKQLTIDEHEKIVMKTLEQAKKEHII